MTRYAIEPYRPELLDQLLRLQAPSWGSSMARAAALFDWKYRRNPYIPEPLFYVALREGRVVGARGMFGTCWVAGGSSERVVLPSASDLVIDPAHRDRGLFREINDFSRADLERRGYDHLLNTSPTPANAVASVMTLGWKTVGSVGHLARRRPAAVGAARLYARVSRPQPSASPLAGQAMTLGRRLHGGLGNRAFRNLDRISRVGPARLGYPISVVREPRIEEMADLVRRAASDGRIHHLRDETFFSWKLENPLAHYRFLFWGDGGLEGYLVLQYLETMSRVNILDWEAPDPDVRLGLLRTAVRWGRFWNLHVWSGTRSAADQAVLRETGFSPAACDPMTARHGGKFLARPAGAEDDEKSWQLCGIRIDRAAAWDLRMIVSDMV